MTSRRVPQPHYERDRTGDIGRVDERDMLFARADLFRRFAEGSPEREQYYAVHPDAREFDEFIAGQERVGSRGGDYRALCDALFSASAEIATEDVVDGDPAEERIELMPEEAARRVKALALALGANVARTGPLRQEWVYSHVGRSFGNAAGYAPWGATVDLTHHTGAIAMGFRMEPDLVHAAPEFPTVLATGAAYAIGAYAAVRLAAYIRSLGYSARAHHLYNYRVLCVPVAVDCGLGELSRAGFLMTREFGLGLRLGVVTTDLPLEFDGPVDIGAQSFCEACEICAEHCPSGAIPRGRKTEWNGVAKWKLDAEKCYRYWYVVSTDCALCMSTCPWTKPPTWLHRGLTGLATVRGQHQRVMVAAERFFYGAPDRSSRGRSTGLESLRPTDTPPKLRAMGVVLVALALVGLWGGAGAGGPGRLASGGWAGYILWMSWTLLGVAVVWTFLAERATRPALIALAMFGAVSVLVGPLVLR